MTAAPPPRRPADPGSIQIGMPVEVGWVRPGGEFALPRFRAAREAQWTSA